MKNWLNPLNIPKYHLFSIIITIIFGLLYYDYSDSLICGIIGIIFLIIGFIGDTFAPTYGQITWWDMNGNRIVDGHPITFIEQCLNALCMIPTCFIGGMFIYGAFKISQSIYYFIDEFMINYKFVLLILIILQVILIINIVFKDNFRIDNKFLKIFLDDIKLRLHCNISEIYTQYLMINFILIIICIISILKYFHQHHMHM